MEGSFVLACLSMEKVLEKQNCPNIFLGCPNSFSSSFIGGPQSAILWYVISKGQSGWSKRKSSDLQNILELQQDGFRLGLRKDFLEARRTSYRKMIGTQGDYEIISFKCLSQGRFHQQAEKLILRFFRGPNSQDWTEGCCLLMRSQRTSCVDLNNLPLRVSQPR